MFRPKLQERRVRFNQKATSRDITGIRGNRSLVRYEDVKRYKVGHKLMWVPVKRAELKALQNSVAGQDQTTEGVVYTYLIIKKIRFLVGPSFVAPIFC
jgi:hypothetical protein